MHTQEQVIAAIRSCWSRETSAEPDKWSIDNPAFGHCDVSSFVAWDYLGGDLVLAQVFIDGEISEHHYRNRIDGTDIDITFEQFTGAEEFTDIGVVEHEQLRNQQAEMKPDVMARLTAIRHSVAQILGEPQRS